MVLLVEKLDSATALNTYSKKVGPSYHQWPYSSISYGDTIIGFLFLIFDDKCSNCLVLLFTKL